MSSDRIIEIETKLSYQEDTISKLNDIVYRQQKQLDEIQQKYELLLSSVRALTFKLGGEENENEIPPHY